MSGLSHLRLNRLQLQRIMQLRVARTRKSIANKKKGDSGAENIDRRGIYASVTNMSCGIEFSRLITFEIPHYNPFCEPRRRFSDNRRPRFSIIGIRSPFYALTFVILDSVACVHCKIMLSVVLIRVARIYALFVYYARNARFGTDFGCRGMIAELRE